ncbi:MAG: PVC-type heme-binding CxxCH protein [Akkermansiaceae bacterium]
MKTITTLLATLTLVGAARAQNKGASVAPPAKDRSATAELASFEIADGYEVSLFASEKDGIANPIAMRWGPRGRLWVLCTLVYPQIIPTDAPGDKLIILEDANHDGRADKVSVFADDLDMPTGFALGNGGVYLGEGDDLIFLADTDGDDRADKRELLLTGFGTGDTHQCINSFTWSPGGELLFGQGLHCFSRVETPWGIVRMDEHGIWRFRPERQQLHAFRGCSGQNPWGLSFGQWGEPFGKSNGGEVSELLPVMIHSENRHNPLDIGRTRIKSMICEIIDSPALPADLQGNIVIAGYFAHIVDRLEISPDGSGHQGTLLPPLWRTDHQSFRPVDIQTGPDGALYVADWYNPIIGHYQASLRHPDRDKKHGRIWRVTATGMKTGNLENLEEQPTQILLEQLQTAPLKERERIRITLSNRDRRTVLVELAAWIRGLKKGDPRIEHHLYEALALHEWHEAINRPLLELLLSAENPLARAYATRVVGRWHDRLDDPLLLLEKSIADPHPRVRLEAVVAASQLPSAAAMTLAMRALDQPTDRFLEAALRQCTHALRPHWFAALQDGSLKMDDAHHLAFALQQTTGQGAAKAARNLLEGGKIELSDESFAPLSVVLATQGTVQDLNWLVELLVKNEEPREPILAALVETAKLRDLKPTHAGLVKSLQTALAMGSEAQQSYSLQLAGLWNFESFGNDLLEIAGDKNESTDLRVAAIEAMAGLKNMGEPCLLTLSELVADEDDSGVRHAALSALLGLDAGRASTIASTLINSAPEGLALEPLVLPFLSRKEGDAILAAALKPATLHLHAQRKIRAILGAAGRHSTVLENVLASGTRKDTLGIPAYNKTFIRELAIEVRKAGDPKRGSEIYHRDSSSCTVCHVIDLCGRDFGPELTAVGAGLPIEILIESVVWPRRQIKEGFLSTTIITKRGQVVSGHVKHEDKQRLVIEDAVTRTRKTIAPKDIASRTDAGSVMPPGLTAQLTREELRDLIRFLSERKGQKLPPEEKSKQ